LLYKRFKFILKGEGFGEIALTLNRPRGASIFAYSNNNLTIGDLELAFISKKDY
jgi:hypothetical protein